MQYSLLILDIPYEEYINRCYKVLWEFQEGWEDVFDNDSVCWEIIDVRITVGDKTIDYTAKEFMERLGFTDE